MNPNKRAWCEVEPSDRAMKQAFLKKNMNLNKRAAAQEKHRNLMYAYTSNRLFPPSILTLRIHLIDHDHPSCHPLSSPTHHPCHPPSLPITNPHHVEYSPHPMPLLGLICAPLGPRRRSRSIATPLEAKCTSSIHLTHHRCHPPSSPITHPHHVEYSPHPTPLLGRICAPLGPKRRSTKIATPRNIECSSTNVYV